jgi:hypothetical protein
MSAIYFAAGPELQQPGLAGPGARPARSPASPPARWAARTIFARFAAANVITDLTTSDFPQPGPPVSTATFAVSANRTA